MGIFGNGRRSTALRLACLMVGALLQVAVPAQAGAVPLRGGLDAPKDLSPLSPVQVGRNAVEMPYLLTFGGPLSVGGRGKGRGTRSEVCLDDWQRSRTAGTAVRSSGCTKSRGQEWLITPRFQYEKYGMPVFRVKNAFSRLCITTAHGLARHGTPIVQGACAGSRQWVREDVEGDLPGRVSIRLRVPGRRNSCLQLGRRAGEPAQIGDCGRAAVIVFDAVRHCTDMSDGPGPRPARIGSAGAGGSRAGRAFCI